MGSNSLSTHAFIESKTRQAKANLEGTSVFYQSPFQDFESCSLDFSVDARNLIPSKPGPGTDNTLSPTNNGRKSSQDGLFWSFMKLYRWKDSFVVKALVTLWLCQTRCLSMDKLLSTMSRQVFMCLCHTVGGTWVPKFPSQ